MKILVIDNYDSFTYNLVQLLGHFERDIIVKRNDEITAADIVSMQPDRILVSPGPGRPEDANISLTAISEFGKHIPVLGVCLGHQAIGMLFGGTVIKAPYLMHGKVSAVTHNAKGVFTGIPQGFTATRYHSLIIERATLPEVLEITAETEDGIIMGVKHKHFPIAGVQFHPESILTTEGSTLLSNWLRQV